MSSRNICDKCGREVPPHNNLQLLVDEWFHLKKQVNYAAWGCRHILPVMENGKAICEGSPSRAQYLEGQPHDPRPEYPHLGGEVENEFRTAYRRLLAKHPLP
ncbi:MAG: hypothetical protein WCO79_02395 [bacterium]